MVDWSSSTLGIVLWSSPSNDVNKTTGSVAKARALKARLLAQQRSWCDDVLSLPQKSKWGRKWNLCLRLEGKWLDIISLNWRASSEVSETSTSIPEGRLRWSRTKRWQKITLACSGAPNNRAKPFAPNKPGKRCKGQIASLYRQLTNERTKSVFDCLHDDKRLKKVLPPMKVISNKLWTKKTSATLHWECNDISKLAQLRMY